MSSQSPASGVGAQGPAAWGLGRAAGSLQVLAVVPVVLLVLAGQEVGEAVALALEKPDEVVGTVVSLLEHQLGVIHLLLSGHHLCRRRGNPGGSATVAASGFAQKQQGQSPSPAINTHTRFLPLHPPGSLCRQSYQQSLQSPLLGPTQCLCVYECVGGRGRAGCLRDLNPSSTLVGAVTSQSLSFFPYCIDLALK